MEKRTKEGFIAKRKYIHDYNRDNYITIGTKIKREDYEDFEELLKSKGMNKSEFIKWAIEKLRSM